MGKSGKKILDGFKEALQMANSATSHSEALPDLYWERPPHTTTERDVLMQRWVVYHYDDKGTCIGIEHQWRPVPVRVNPSTER